jgi:hypothetical protein
MDDNKKVEETNQEEPELPKQFSDNIEKEKNRYKVMAEVEFVYGEYKTESIWESVFLHRK